MYCKIPSSKSMMYQSARFLCCRRGNPNNVNNADLSLARLKKAYTCSQYDPAMPAAALNSPTLFINLKLPRDSKPKCSNDASNSISNARISLTISPLKNHKYEYRQQNKQHSTHYNSRSISIHQLP